ncbi:MAG: aminofutalosine synthase MqnE [Thermanaeromonas sp.]|uniref:aminofutalosine synthase MqnE n=1 Tax=Thermanaeromonas sp. TaxID=2003697 RepID=UPI00243D0EAA|nr:aminofutalosine synthase MqnE [Thermanaeromonas sp.]MCG0278202.1 aminofutalosine synthase MqnE [Thermanaeromonas sp.]
MLEEAVLKGPLGDIAEKVFEGERLSREDGIRLMESDDLLAVGFLADFARKKKVGDEVYFINNAHINYTNVCRNLCSFCAFGRPADAEGAYTLSIEEIAQKAEHYRKYEPTEIHIVGGLNPALPFSYYEDMLRTIKEILPQAHLQAFDAVEIDFISEISGLSLEEVLLRLKEAGLGSLPGGGAEIFNPAVRSKICPRKISGERWLEVHATAHRLGIRTNATMLYGHIESLEDRVDHLLALREQQDRTGGFMAFIPLPFHPANTGLKHLPPTTGYDDLKTLAVSRLLLDNFDHIKAFWIMLTPKVAQIALHFGVDDLDGTVREEHIAHDAGAETPQYHPAEEFLRLIREAGRIPVERDTLYNVVRRY